MKITYFVITFESFDTESFVKALKAYDTNGVIIVWNYSGAVRVESSPPGLSLPKAYRFFEQGTWTASSWIKWPSFLISMAFMMTLVFFQAKVRRFFITGGDVLLWVAQIFKNLGRCEMTVTTLDDWSVPPPSSDLGDWVNRKKFLFNDRLLNAMDTKVLVLTPEVLEARNRYWSDKPRRNSVLYQNRWVSMLETARPKPKRVGSEILLLGSMRRNFGVEILFDLLPELNREHGITLRVIGLESALYLEFKAACEASGVGKFIKWRGFVDMKDLPAECDDAFCGYDMQQFEVNNSRFVIPGRVVHYLQNYLVPVISEYSGTIIPFLRERNLGVICHPDRESIKRAILEARERNVDYVDRIDEFFVNNPYRAGVEPILFL